MGCMQGTGIRRPQAGGKATAYPAGIQYLDVTDGC
jgi:hypothetical protein